MRKVLHGDAILEKAKKIPVPEPGTGEFVTIPVEVLSVWMKLNHRKAQGWRGSLLMTVPDVEAAEVENELSSEGDR